MPTSYVNPGYSFTKDEWYVHILNTEGLKGHSVMVIEGMRPTTLAFFEKKGSTQLEEEEFVGHYEMSYKKLVPGGENLLVNKRGYFNRVNVFEPGGDRVPQSGAYMLYERRDYRQYPSRTISITYTQAQLIIDSIKVDQKKCDEARNSGGRVEGLPYQALGKGHWLVELFGDNEDGHNCASWCIEKLQAGGVNISTLLPKPKVVSSCSLL